MAKRRRTFLLVTVLAVASTTAFAKTTLQVLRGSGEFQTLEAAVTLTSQEEITMQWMTDQAGATGGTWRVTNITAGNKLVASGESKAPAPGHFLRFTIVPNAFLQAASPATPITFHITIVPHDAVKTLGPASPAVVVTQVPKGPPPKPVNFGGSATWPSLEIVNYNEKIGQVPQTQLHFAGADVTLRVSNKGKTPTDPVWVGVDDSNLLMRQTNPRVSVPSLKPGASQTVALHMNAILPAPMSQMPEDQQYTQWAKEYWTRCGVLLRGVMDWRGPQAQAPMNDHFESALVEEGFGDYGKTSPSAPICDSAQCVKPCQMVTNIVKQLDGHAVGYAFFMGQYPRFYGAGHARTDADGTERAFTPATKITVASVSKMVTAIAAVAILGKNGVNIDAPIGPYLPSDWSASDYVRNIKFSQLLSQTSGIKDYGNVSQDYASLKRFFTQPVSSSTKTDCQGSDVKNPSDPINPNLLDRCYSNYNFSIFRVLLPKVVGLPEDNNPITRPQTLADQYVKLVQQNVFEPVGRKGVACKPSDSTYAFGYDYPGSRPGHDWGDATLVCGAAGWYLSVEDIAKVLLSINAKDGKILNETPKKQQFDTMRKRWLGWDRNIPTELEKNGMWKADCDKDGNHCNLISTSVAIFGPVTGPRVIGILFINSNIAAGQGAKQALENAYAGALYPKP